jgi:hypothetical protein
MKYLAILLLALVACAPAPQPLKPDVPAPVPVAPDDMDVDSQPRPDIAPETFAGALQKQLEGKGNLSRDEKRVLKILNSQDSPRRDRQLAKMERHARAEMGWGMNGEIDWSADVDWLEVFTIILELLIRLLPLLFG